MPTVVDRRRATDPRSRGAFYTPAFAARMMTEWAVRTSTDRVLEPSMGDGVFLQAINELQRSMPKVSVLAVEFDEETYGQTVNAGLVSSQHAICGDFLTVSPSPVDAVIGNPPYIRLRHLPQTLARRACRVASTALGETMDASGSTWMPFVLHATQFLTPGGRLALVLPYEITYVRYAKPLWRWLSERFGTIEVHRVKERLFPDILQDTVVLLADDRGHSTRTVRFYPYETCSDFLRERPLKCTEIAVSHICGDSRPFVHALLPQQLHTLLNTEIAAVTEPAKERVAFNIGYVSGDKSFFHPTDDVIRRFRIPRGSLKQAIASARCLRGAGMTTHGVNGSAAAMFLPPKEPRRLRAGDVRYIQHGENTGVADRYKCRVRDPWYVTPGVRIPDLLMPVFSERPVLVRNAAGYAASNSLLCGYMKTAYPSRILSAWYTSLTLLQLEMQIHALGGGVLVVVPREAGNLRLPKLTYTDRGHLRKVDRLLKGEDVECAFQSGDTPVLRDQLNLSPAEIDVIKEGVDLLSAWRSGVRGTRMT